MRTRNLATLIGSSAGMLLLILDSKTAIRGMHEGIQLCLNTLLPALFPFCVLSILITGSIIGKRMALFSPICKICRIPSGCESLFAVGILGGYPVGAQNVILACQDGKLSRDDARRMAVFCNNAGPAFIFGILGPIFPNPVFLWGLWGIQIFSALITGALIPGGCCDAQPLRHTKAPTIPEAIHAAARGMVSICSCVILFRMVLEFLSQWLLWHFPTAIQVIISGLLELSNGCLILTAIEDPHLRFIVAAGFLSFGGACVWMQTLSICDGLELKCYLPWKAFQSAISVVLAFCSISLPCFSVILILIILATVLLSICLVGGCRKKEVAF